MFQPNILELVFCKKRPKIVPDQLHTGFGNKGPLKVLNGTKLLKSVTVQELFCRFLQQSSSTNVTFPFFT